MSSIDLQKLVARLNQPCRRALEAAAGAALSRSHFNVEIEHWLLQLIEAGNTDIDQILRHSELDRGRVIAGLNIALDRMKTGNGRSPSLAPDLVAIAKDALLIGVVEKDAVAVRSGHLLCAALADEAVWARLRGLGPEWRALLPDVVRRDLGALSEGSVEQNDAATVAGTGEAAPDAGSGGSALARFTTDLTRSARDGKLDPVLGRDDEIRQVIDIISRRRQNNPILAGEAGVGKTAIVEGLALRIAAGDVPEALLTVSLHVLDLGLLQAGAGVKGEFENRLRSVIDDVKASPHPIVLFIDEAHTLIGAGGAAGQGDAANLLKPALARGELRCIAATTWAEYKKYIEKDAALARRFQAVKVDEPSDAVAIEMVRGLVPTLEKHHGVRILDEATEAAVLLSRRFIADRQLPDKAVSLIDTACARVAMSQNATPPVIEVHKRRQAAIDSELRLLKREASSGSDHSRRMQALEEEAARLTLALADEEERWESEKLLVTTLLAARGEAESDSAEDGLALGRAVEARQALRDVQGEAPMIFPEVDAQAVAAIVSNWTGIPAGRMRADEVQRVLTLEDALRSRVIGQDHALTVVSEAIRISRAGLTDPRKPVGVFLMVGTSGIGKTETAAALADILYGGPQSLTTINMTEFKEEHKVSLLMGSPPGYVGYGEGGVLTEAVRRRPHSVLLLDEVEKAHPGVQDVFFQVFDKGTMKDGEGRDVDFRNTIIIMTTNACSDVISSLFADPLTAPDVNGLSAVLRESLLQHFKAAFLGRVTVVPYLPLDEGNLEKIVDLQLRKLATMTRNRFGVELEVSPELRAGLIDPAAIAQTGARSIENRIGSQLTPVLSRLFLESLSTPATIERIALVPEDGGGVSARVS
ncbi:type VI secretion system ATPase TssH [Acetobacteraceae bacterium KSS8]|uniref:Type VI secretion system ATPase TssH n=1 Tax=Endosaccharibacter trunci TaxID=2812733 RepID=A0ABT1W7B8_9PROT|nr:type VI secretion system ATPase TssH [Acetobacteraceae bacterium KSS8]